MIEKFLEDIRLDATPEYFKKYPESIKDLDKELITEEIARIVVEQKGALLAFIPNPSPEVRYLALKNNGDAIKHIEEPTDYECFLAVSSSPLSLRFIKQSQRTEDLCREAVWLNGEAIKYSPFQTEEICLQAAETYKKALAYIKNPGDRVIEESLKRYPDGIKYLENPSDEVAIKALEQGASLEYIKNPSREVLLFAVKKSGINLRHISEEDQDEEICMEAVKQHGGAFIYAKVGTREVVKEALRGNPFHLEIVEEQDEELCMIAIKGEPATFKYVEKQTEALCKVALELDGRLLELVEDQTEELVLTALNSGLSPSPFSIKVITVKVLKAYKSKSKTFNTNLLNALSASYKLEKYLPMLVEAGYDLDLLNLTQDDVYTMMTEGRISIHDIPSEILSDKFYAWGRKMISTDEIIL